MASTAQLNALRALHPDWSEQEIVAAGNQYDAMVAGAKQAGSLAGTTINVPDITKAITKAPVLPNSSASAEPPVFKQSANDVINSIVANAGKTDPTSITGVAGNSTLPNVSSQAGGLAPNVTTLGNQEYSNQYLQQYFGGLNGQQPLVTQSVDPKTKQPFIGMNNNGSLDYVAIYGDPKNPTKFKVTDLGTAYNDYLKEALSSGQTISQLKLSLYEEGNGIKSAEAKTSLAGKDNNDATFRKAIINKLLTITNNNYNNIKFKGMTNDFIPWTGQSSLGPYGVNYAGTHVSSQKNLLDIRNAGVDLDQFMQEYLGRNATTQETDKYLQAYNSFAASKSGQTIVTTTTDNLNLEKSRTTKGGMTADDALAIKVGIASDALRAAGKDPNDISKLGGKVGTTINALKQTAADYGLQYDDNMALQDTIKSIQPGASVAAQQTTLKNLAKIHYKSLASAIDSGVTIRDIANQFGQLNQKYLETVTPADPMSSDIQKALTGGKDGGLMNMSDYTAYLKSKPEWAKTQNAHEEASNYATTILKQFGFIG